MIALTEEQRHFLLGAIRTGKLATVRADGRPHVVPIWYQLDGDTLVFNTGATTVKVANMRRDARVSLCVDDENPPFTFMMIEGTATLIEDLAEIKYWASRIGGRYMGEDQAEAFGERNGVPGELLVRVTPTKIHFVKDLAS